MYNKFFIIIIFIFVVGCGGRSPNPIKTYHHMDESMSCSDISSEISEIERKIKILIPESKKTGKNVALGATGFFFIVPLFFMDFSDAEKIEIEALQERYNYLQRLYRSKNCCSYVKK